MKDEKSLQKDNSDKEDTIEEEQINKRVDTSLRKIIRKHQIGSFPTLSCLLIAFGIAGLYIAGAVTQYIDAGNEIINQIPDMQEYYDSGSFSLYSQYDIREPKWVAVEIPNISRNSVIHVAFEVIPGWIAEWPLGSLAWEIEAYLFDENNYTIWLQDKDKAVAIDKSIDKLGEMYGIAPEDGDYYAVFDNSFDDQMQHSNTPYKEVDYTLQAVIPAHVERIKNETGTNLGEALHYPFFGMIIVGAISLSWWVFQLYKDKKFKR